MVVGCKQRPAFVALMQILNHCPGDGEAIVSSGAASDLIENNKRALTRLVKDCRGLNHFDHKRRASAR